MQMDSRSSHPRILRGRVSEVFLTNQSQGASRAKRAPKVPKIFWHPKDLEVVPHPEIIIHINNDMNINIHIDINMNIDIHTIINMNIDDYKKVLFINY